MLYLEDSMSGPNSNIFTLSPGSPGHTPLPGARFNVSPTKTESTGRSSTPPNSPTLNGHKQYFTNKATYDKYIVAIDDLHNFTNIVIVEDNNPHFSNDYFYPFTGNNNASFGLTFGRMILIAKEFRNSSTGGKRGQTKHHKKSKRGKRTTRRRA